MFVDVFWRKLIVSLELAYEREFDIQTSTDRNYCHFQIKASLKDATLSHDTDTSLLCTDRNYCHFQIKAGLRFCVCILHPSFTLWLWTYGYVYVLFSFHLMPTSSSFFLYAFVI